MSCTQECELYEEDHLLTERQDGANGANGANGGNGKRAEMRSSSKNNCCFYRIKKKYGYAIA